jgi:polyphosphate kinase 2 (PPK2 family)
VQAHPAVSDNDIRLVKLFLNVSKEEHRARFLKRIDRPQKNWKFSASDVRERRHWDD